MRICYLNITEYIPTRDLAYLKGLKEQGIEIIEIRDSSPGFWRKLLNIYRRHRQLKGRYDLLWIGYSGCVLVPFARLVSRRPIIFNALGSFYDGVILSPGQGQNQFSFKALRFWLIDWLSFHAATLNLVENNIRVEYLSRRYWMPRKKFFSLWTGVDEDSFFYNPDIPKLAQFTVLFRGALPYDSGIEYFVEAAKILAHTDIKFKLLGRGLMAPQVEALLKTFDSKNFEWNRQMLDIADLRKQMQEVHLNVGWLSNILRAPTSIPHKTFESLALKSPLLNARLPAVMELLEDNQTVFFCEPNDPQAVADKILELRDNPELLNRVAENGYNLFDKTLRSRHLALRLLTHLKEAGIIPSTLSFSPNPGQKA